MSAATNMPVLVSTLGLGAAVAILSAVPTAREAMTGILGVSAPGWRVFRHILYQIYLAPKPMTAPHLFKPLITSSYNAITECDYNLHKSNSTYFADLDASRAALMGALLRKSITRLNKGDMTGLPEEAKKAKGSYIIALGGIACTFRKEIKPLESYEIWTKVMTWDEKWIYVISHVVKSGAKKPTTFHLQPWKKGTSKKTETQQEENKDWTKAVFATSIAKYVCKKGRLTIPPEIFLTRGDLLPPKPSNLPSPVMGAESPATTTGGATPAVFSSSASAPTSLTSPDNLAAEVTTKLGRSIGAEKSDDETAAAAAAAVEAVDGEGMTWDDVEKERQRGLVIAKNFDSLATLHGEFGADDEVLGQYSDYFFW